ncbi:cupin domain-containing protein [Simplicispira suum]|uniref:Mannose-6-phosphate isomerase n=1 Tax=Simplicispira suum TaxID=2109915 RepID=A0A2S0N162_9BURK|nr:cupin domain-containing protein [Simplicispira suum]AVO41894.1 mannose-6-phosphate isomerase [Simplicispira suum]
MKSRYVISSEDANPYSPANHTGTSNQRVISRETVGAKYVEVLIGTIEKGHGALRHLHPNLEQASYLLQGEGLAEFNGVEEMARPGRWMLTPEGAPHRFTVTSEIPVKVLVVYAPPYAENPRAAVNCEDAPAALDEAGLGVRDDALRNASKPFAPKHSDGVHFSYALDLPEGTARHMAIFDARFDSGARVSSHTLEKMEQVIFLRKGSLAGSIAGDEFQAREGDWIFFPDGAPHEYSVSSANGAEAFVIHAFSFH